MPNIIQVLDTQVDTTLGENCCAIAGTTFDDIVVESSLNVRRKDLTRQGRTKVSGDSVILQPRTKRQQDLYNGFGGSRYPSSFPSGFGSGFGSGFPSGGASAANAQAQGFESHGPLGGFGASATGAQTQSFGFGPGGFTGGAGLSGSQNYRLPNGQSIDVSYSNGFSVGPDGKPAISRGSAININRGQA